MSAPTLFHIIAESDWRVAKELGEYRPAGLANEGFIHLSKKNQILRPANLLYRGRTDLALLVIDPSSVTSDVVYEPGSHGETEHFPHLYGPLNLDAVIGVVPFPCNASANARERAGATGGGFDLPEGLPD